MSYVQLQNIRQGMDRKRRQRVVGEAGTAWTIKNGHLTRGGDIDRRKKFVKQEGSFPSTTSGLYSLKDNLYTVGYSSAQAANVPTGVNHILTQHPTTSTPLLKALDADGFDGKLYSIVEFTDNTVHHFYDTRRVTDWDTISTNIGTNDALATALAASINKGGGVTATALGNVITVTANTAGVAFNLTATATNNGPNPDQTITVVETQANVVARDAAVATASLTIVSGTYVNGKNTVNTITVDGVDILNGPAEVLATGQVTITGGTSSAGVNKVDTITVNAVDILGVPVDHTGNNTTTATAIAAQINSHISSPNYSATSSGAVVTISGVEGSGYSPNGFAINVTESGNVTETHSSTMSGGMNRGINWWTSNSATATAIANRINSQTTSPNYTATASGSTVTVSALSGTGSAPNGFAFNVTESGDLINTHDTVMSGGVDPVSAVAQTYAVTVGGTFEDSDTFTVKINSSSYSITPSDAAMGRSILTFKKKLYSTASSSLYFSALNGPTQWISGTDYGFINMASEIAGQENLLVAEEYQGLMVILSENSIRIWSMSEDSSANVFVQTLSSTGTLAPHSVIPYGASDVFYLASSGIRSIKARDSSNAAYVSDVGTPIDTHIREYMDTLTKDEISAAVGIVEPVEGRFWLGIKNRIYVLSFFPTAKISGWSYYEVDFTIKNFAKKGEQIFVRGEEDGVDYLYLYGGEDGNTYPGIDEDVCLVELPYLSANDPAGNKHLSGYDIVAINTWKVELLPDPNNEDVKIDLGMGTNVTYGQPRFGVSSVTPLFALTLTCSAAGPATLSALAMHYNGPFDNG